MESKSGSIHSKSLPPMDSPKKDIVGGVSEEIGGDLKEDSVDEDGGGRVSKGDDEFDMAQETERLLMVKWSDCKCDSIEIFPDWGLIGVGVERLVHNVVGNVPSKIPSL